MNHVQSVYIYYTSSHAGAYPYIGHGLWYFPPFPPPHADIESECMPNVESKQVEYLGQLRQNGLVSGNCDLMLYYIIMTQYVMCECFYV